MTDAVIWSIVIGVIIVGFLIHLYVWKHYHYICPKCFHSFKPTFIHSLIAVNAAELRKLKCPNCKSKEYMKALKNQKIRTK